MVYGKLLMSTMHAGCQSKAKEECCRQCSRASRAWGKWVSGNKHKEGGAGQEVQG